MFASSLSQYQDFTHVAWLRSATTVNKRIKFSTHTVCDAERKRKLLILGKGYTGGGLASFLQEDEDW